MCEILQSILEIWNYDSVAKLRCTSVSLQLIILGNKIWYTYIYIITLLLETVAGTRDTAQSATSCFIDARVLEDETRNGRGVAYENMPALWIVTK